MQGNRSALAMGTNSLCFDTTSHRHTFDMYNYRYFEKHQAHPYQNSKYGKSSRGEYSDRYMRESPNGNSYRSDSPECDSPRDRERDKDRGYKSTYLQKIREKERDRDFKREKYSECARSPKDKRRERCMDLEHRTNHDRGDCLNSSVDKMSKCSSRSSGKSSSNSVSCLENKSMQRNSSGNSSGVQNNQPSLDDRERVTRVGDWSEHLSSSGKKYYYNCKTEVSQWEKPREWIERSSDRDRDRERERERDRDRERERERERDRERERERERDRERDRPERDRSDRGDRERDRERDRDRDRERERERERDRDRGPSAGGGGPISAGNSRTNSISKDHRDDREARYSAGSLRNAHDKHSSTRLRECISRGEAGLLSRSRGSWCSSDVSDSRRKPDGDNTQDMDISPGDSTPTSEASYGHLGTPSTRHCGTPASDGTSQQAGLITTVLPRLSSHPTTPCSTSSASRSYNKTSQSPNSSNMGPNMMSVVNASNQMTSMSGSHNKMLPQLNANSKNSNDQSDMNSQKMMQNSISQSSCSSLKIDTNVGVVGDGPPTPTHSENHDISDRIKTDIPNMSTVPNLSSLQGLSQSSVMGMGSALAALRPQGPNLTPGLANHCRQDLLAHVQGWPADVLEKQANKFTEESLTMGNIQCTRVSADLKIARSIVRLTEIQATLQDQRLMYLRQQIQRLEDLKSQNSFSKMSEDL